MLERVLVSELVQPHLCVHGVQRVCRKRTSQTTVKTTLCSSLPDLAGVLLPLGLVAGVAPVDPRVRALHRWTCARTGFISVLAAFDLVHGNAIQCVAAVFCGHRRLAAGSTDVDAIKLVLIQTQSH